MKLKEARAQWKQFLAQATTLLLQVESSNPDPNAMAELNQLVQHTLGYLWLHLGTLNPRTLRE